MLALTNCYDAVALFIVMKLLDKRASCYLGICLRATAATDDVTAVVLEKRTILESIK